MAINMSQDKARIAIIIDQKTSPEYPSSIRFFHPCANAVRSNSFFKKYCSAMIIWY